jgi:hypothetical protein
VLLVHKRFEQQLRVQDQRCFAVGKHKQQYEQQVPPSATGLPGNTAHLLDAHMHELTCVRLCHPCLQHAAAGASLVVFDIPLLYETKAEQQLDLVLVVSAPADVQQQRVLARPGMTPEKLAAILARQVC